MYRKNKETYQIAVLILGGLTIITIVLLLVWYLACSFVLWELLMPDWIIWAYIIRAWYLFLLFVTAVLVWAYRMKAEEK